jgi:hypothetical protein
MTLDISKGTLSEIKGGRCGFCGGERTTFTGDYHGGDEYKKYLMCESCGKEWSIIYTPTRIEEIKKNE